MQVWAVPVAVPARDEEAPAAGMVLVEVSVSEVQRVRTGAIFARAKQAKVALPKAEKAWRKLEKLAMD